jgi:hypothetical protein
MKQFFFLLMVLAPVAVLSQQPVQWSFSVEKIRTNQYKVNLTARIQPGYHVFALAQPEDAIATPTKINITTNPEVSDIGCFAEEGVMQRVKDEMLGIESWHFSEKVSFTGIVTLRSRNKTLLSGQVEFQVCSEDKCYPPTRVNFNLPLNH